MDIQLNPRKRLDKSIEEITSSQKSIKARIFKKHTCTNDITKF